MRRLKDEYDVYLIGDKSYKGLALRIKNDIHGNKRYKVIIVSMVCDFNISATCQALDSWDAVSQVYEQYVIK